MVSSTTPRIMKKLLSLLLLIASPLTLAQTTFQPEGTSFRFPVTVARGFTAQVIFSNLTTPRGIAFDSSENLLAVERGLGVTAFSQSAVTPRPGWQRTVLIRNADLTHGIQVDAKTIYVSTGKEVLAYAYDPVTKRVGDPYPLITGVPELTTHTLELEFDNTGATVAILVGSGPLTNIDPTARDPANGRSQIRRFPLNTLNPVPLTWARGQILAYGIRNPGGFTWSPPTVISPIQRRQLYVVENGASIDDVNGFTATFANDNPSDELNVVTLPLASDPVSPSRSYGFPDCAPLWNPSADPLGNPEFVGLRRGTQFSLRLERTRNDEWCRNTTNNIPPVLNFQAHSVPLDIKFYGDRTSYESPTSFPSTLIGDAFVSFRGSFNRKPPTGYGVVHVPFPLNDTVSNALGYSFLIQASDLENCPGSCIRPVGLAFGKDGRLYVSSDATGELFVLGRSLLTPV
ncbi:hypothetical protein AX16_007179 [Volvariella volvacea WC 439]|nr:hypothetical protein AX16_007179 [Volvariella volvacea WC 439]